MGAVAIDDHEEDLPGGVVEQVAEVFDESGGIGVSPSRDEKCIFPWAKTAIMFTDSPNYATDAVSKSNDPVSGWYAVSEFGRCSEFREVTKQVMSVSPKSGRTTGGGGTMARCLTADRAAITRFMYQRLARPSFRRCLTARAPDGTRPVVVALRDDHVDSLLSKINANGWCQQRRCPLAERLHRLGNGDSRG